MSGGGGGRVGGLAGSGGANGLGGRATIRVSSSRTLSTTMVSNPDSIRTLSLNALWETTPLTICAELL